MRKQQQYSIMVKKNANYRVGNMANESGLTKGALVDKVFKMVWERASPYKKTSKLPDFFIFELLHLREVEVINDEELKILLENEAAEGIVVDVCWSDDMREKAEILSRYDIVNNKFV